MAACSGDPKADGTHPTDDDTAPGHTEGPGDTESRGGGETETQGESDTGRHTTDSDDTGESADTGEGPLRWVAMDLQNESAVAITSRGQAECWGDEAYGALGCTSDGLTAVAMGYIHGCGIRTDRTLACWGADGSATVSRGEDFLFDQAMPPAGEYIGVSAGDTQSCAISTKGQIVCWGWDDYRLLPPSGEYTFVDSSNNWNCALDVDGRVECWGIEALGRLDGPLGTGWTALTLGLHHGCALDAAGQASCWGGIKWDTANAPLHIQFLTLSAGVEVTCGVTTDTSIYCWGSQFYGEGWIPYAVPKTKGWERVWAYGNEVACALSLEGELYCWGDESGSELFPVPDLPE